MSWYQWYPTVLRRYAVFRGRAGRPEFWWFQLVNVLILLAGLIWVEASGSSASRAVLNLYELAVFLPSLGVEIRRLHDIDKSGWWVLLCFVPIVGTILLIVWLATAGTPGPNRFGDGAAGDPASPAPSAFQAPAWDPERSAGSHGGEGYCARCGSAITPGAGYCRNCGAPVA
jgi:uncharacterized membrane protein YhaH (DUF805 family)